MTTYPRKLYWERRTSLLSRPLAQDGTPFTCVAHSRSSEPRRIRTIGRRGKTATSGLGAHGVVTAHDRTRPAAGDAAPRERRQVGLCGFDALQTRDATRGKISRANRASTSSLPASSWSLTMALKCTRSHAPPGAQVGGGACGAAWLLKFSSEYASDDQAQNTVGVRAEEC